MAWDQIIESESESEADSEQSHGSASVSEGPDSTVSIPRLNNLVNYLLRKLAKSNLRIKSLLKEVAVLKEVTNTNSLPDQVQPGNSTQVQKLEEENSSLKNQVKDLKNTLERFSLGSKNLDLILGTQRAVYNRTGLGFKPKRKYKSYLSIIQKANRKTVQASPN